MYKLIFIPAFLLSCLYGKGQEKTGADFLRRSQFSQDRGAYDSGIVYAREAIYLFTQTGQPDPLGESYVMLWSNMSLKNMPNEERAGALTQAASAFSRAGNKKREADCYKERGDLRQMDGRWAPALDDLKKALQLYQATGYPRLQGVYDLLGNVYVQLHEYKEGLRYGLLAVSTAESLHDTTMFCTIYNRLGIAYQQAKDNGNAHIYFDKALAIAERNNDNISTITLANNIAALLIQENRPGEVLTFIAAVEKRNPAIRQEDDFRRDIPCVLIAAYSMLGQYDKARPWCGILEQELTHKLDNYEEEGEIYKRLLQFYLATGDYRRAAGYLSMFDKFCKRLNMPIYSADNYLYKYRIDSAKGRYLSAIEDLKRYKTLEDTIFNETRSRQVNQFSALYETEKKDKNIHLLQQQSELQQSHLRQANNLRNFILAGAGSLLIILTLLYRAYRTKRFTNKVLRQHQEEIDQKNLSLQRLVNEKEWLLKEIHHRVKNNLHMVVGLLASQAEYIRGEEAIIAITESQHRIQAMSLIHQKLYQTESLSHTNMPSYILELVDYLKSSFGQDLPIRFALNIANVDFPLSHSIPIALILNEAIINSIKYAFPGGKKGEISISLRQTTEQHFKMTVKDNGVGLPTDFNLKNNASLGITLMKGLSDDIGGRLSLVSGDGTSVELAFTIDPGQT